VDNRRLEIANALLRLVTKGGFEAVSMRSVAEEAGLSLGMVQRHFASKEAMLHHALDYSVTRFEQRVRAKLETTTTPREVLFSLLVELFLVTPETRGEVQIWLSLLHQAVIHHDYQPYLQAHYRALLEFIQGLLPTSDNATVQALLALADGLTIQRLLGTISHEDALTVLTKQMTLLLGEAKPT
jgi:TetR/AcrR family transcriptional regulator, transcriptional repressor of bet genes